MRTLSVAAVAAMAFLGLNSCSGEDSSPTPNPTSGDTTAPVITLQGEDGILLLVGDDFTDPGFTAIDNVDATVEVTVSGDVDPDTIGNYLLTYEATDSAGNTATERRQVDVVGESLFDFYSNRADRFELTETYTKSLDTFIYASDDLRAGDFASAKERVDNIFLEQPVGSSVWRSFVGAQGLNVGDPTAYYALRMLQQITAAGDVPTRETLVMTAVIAPCASVSRPTDPSLASETVDLTVDPRISANDYALLYEVTETFRIWVKAITGGSEVELRIYETPDCTRVDFFPNGTNIFSYPDSTTMINDVPQSIKDQTDMWWAIAPSGVPENDEDFSQIFVTGGMGTDEFGNALFISDDAWFIEVPKHLGSGDYSEVEQRAYLPQWFQHEYMHHVYDNWPQFELEVTLHQWFDRSTWPSDFVGDYESDYYYDSVEKRLKDANPSLAEGLRGRR
ncbi:MAG: DUF5011 domain-containing protein [Pseudomonadota bacterium]